MRDTFLLNSIDWRILVQIHWLAHFCSNPLLTHFCSNQRLTHFCSNHWLTNFSLNQRLTHFVQISVRRRSEGREREASTSSALWMPSWSGLGWSAARLRRKTQKCTIPKFRKDSARNGNCWRKVKNVHLSTRLNESELNIWLIIQTTNTDRVENLRIWRLQGIPTPCPILLYRWRL